MASTPSGLHFGAAAHGTGADMVVPCGRLCETGPHHADTLHCMTSLASALEAQEKFGEAEAMFREVLEGQAKLFGPEHEEMLLTAHDLANTLYNQVRALHCTAHSNAALVEGGGGGQAAGTLVCALCFAAPTGVGAWVWQSATTKKHRAKAPRVWFLLSYDAGQVRGGRGAAPQKPRGDPRAPVCGLFTWVLCSSALVCERARSLSLSPFLSRCLSTPSLLT